MQTATTATLPPVAPRAAPPRGILAFAASRIRRTKSDQTGARKVLDKSSSSFGGDGDKPPLSFLAAASPSGKENEIVTPAHLLSSSYFYPIYRRGGARKRSDRDRTGTDETAQTASTAAVDAEPPVVIMSSLMSSTDHNCFIPVLPPTKQAVRPQAGSSTMQMPENDDKTAEDISDSSNSREEKPEESARHTEPHPGQQLDQSQVEQVFPGDDETKEAHRIRWRAVKGQKICVRSKEYLQRKTTPLPTTMAGMSSYYAASKQALLQPQQPRKVPSNGELYECVKVDFVESSHRLANMSSRVELPELEPEMAGTCNWHAPDIFVVSLSMPSDPNGGKEDGPSFTISMYFAMKAETRKLLEYLTRSDRSLTDESLENHPHIPALRLFNDWCRLAPTDPQFQARFKLIPSCENLIDLGLPTWIARWNAKPILIKRSGKTGFLYAHDSVIEMEVSFHAFPWATKQAIQYLREHVLRKLLLTFGFVIEGRCDDELPETLVGLCQLYQPKPEHAIPAHEFFGEEDDEKEEVGATANGYWSCNTDDDDRACDD